MIQSNCHHIFTPSQFTMIKAFSESEIAIGAVSVHLYFALLTPVAITLLHPYPLRIYTTDTCHSRRSSLFCIYTSVFLSRLLRKRKKSSRINMAAADLQLPPGFRFHPTDEELVTHYLCRKCASLPLSIPNNTIAEIDIYKFDPWELPELAMNGEKAWYFFTPRDRKYPNGCRPNRSAGSGYWKATGADKPIGRPKQLAIKKALVFYAGKAPKGEKTNWIMHEYRLADVDRSPRNKSNILRLDDWVLCRIYNKKGVIEKKSNPNSERLPPLVPPPATAISDYLQVEASDSAPRFHPDSSCSEQQVVSPDFASEREVESEPKWKDLINNNALDFQFNYVDATVDNNAFAVPPTQLFPLQDMFMFTQQKPY